MGAVMRNHAYIVANCEIGVSHAHVTECRKSPDDRRRKNPSEDQAGFPAPPGRKRVRKQSLSQEQGG